MFMSNKRIFSQYFKDQVSTLEFKPKSIVFYPDITECTRWSQYQTDKLKNVIKSCVDEAGNVKWNEVGQQMNMLPIDCLIQVRNNDCVSRTWTKDEEIRLVELFEKYEGHDWCAIALELGTNRSPLECLRYYQRSLNASLLTSNEWTREEDENLREAVALYGTNWQHVANSQSGRSASQCAVRWRKSAVCQQSVVSGNWLEDEERLLFLACVAYKVPSISSTKRSQLELDQLLLTKIVPDFAEMKKPTIPWSAIAKLVPGKTDVQCREKWSNNLDPNIRVGKYTKEEDNLLVQIVEILGTSNWTKVASFMIGRSDASVRQRWITLKNQETKESATGDNTLGLTTSSNQLIQDIMLHQSNSDVIS